MNIGFGILFLRKANKKTRREVARATELSSFGQANPIPLLSRKLLPWPAPQALKQNSMKLHWENSQTVSYEMYLMYCTISGLSLLTVNISVHGKQGMGGERKENNYFGSSEYSAALCKYGHPRPSAVTKSTFVPPRGHSLLLFPTFIMTRRCEGVEKFKKNPRKVKVDRFFAYKSKIGEREIGGRPWAASQRNPFLAPFLPSLPLTTHTHNLSLSKRLLPLPIQFQRAVNLMSSRHPREGNQSRSGPELC